MRHETVSTLRCYAGEQAYCLDVDQVTGIERGAQLSPNPDADGPIGWIARSGRKIPVYSLVERLGGGTRSREVGAILVMNSEDPWGLAVDRISRFQRAHASSPEPVPPTLGPLSGSFFRGVTVEEGTPMLHLCPERLHPNAPPASVTPVPPRTQENANAPVTASPGRLLLFSLPNHVPPGILPNGRSRLWFALSYSQVLEIVSGIRYSPVPSAPPDVLGLIAWRRRATPVVDAGKLFGLPPVEFPATQRLLIAHSPVWRMAIAVPAGAEMQTRVLPVQHRPCNLPLDPNSTRGIFEIGEGQFVVFPDINAIAGRELNSGSHRLSK